MPPAFGIAALIVFIAGIAVVEGRPFLAFVLVMIAAGVKV